VDNDLQIPCKVRKRNFVPTFYIKTISLPRQARDKHRKNSKRNRFLTLCKLGEPKHPLCNDAEQAAVVQYGSDFLEALKPVIESAPKNGAFITSCVCHGCPWSEVTTGASENGLLSRLYVKPIF
jgi:hypothetical protein